MFFLQAEKTNRKKNGINNVIAGGGGVIFLIKNVF
jgi:hypothetical protein